MANTTSGKLKTLLGNAPSGVPLQLHDLVNAGVTFMLSVLGYVLSCYVFVSTDDTLALLSSSLGMLVFGLCVVASLVGIDSDTNEKGPGV